MEIYLIVPGNLRIGVLGGIGPEATGEFYNKLIFALQKKGMVKQNKDYPQIIVNSIPAPELIYDIISTAELKPYVSGLKELDRMGVDFIVMVCNTIHLYYDDLQKEVNAPIIELCKAVRDRLEKKKIKSVLVIGTPNTIRNGLYRFEGMRTMEPTPEEQKQMADAILLFNRGIEKYKQKNIVKDICNRYLEKGAEIVILGCTEFAVMLQNSTPCINTIDVMVDAVVERLRV